MARSKWYACRIRDSHSKDFLVSGKDRYVLNDFRLKIAIFVYADGEAPSMVEFDKITQGAKFLLCNDEEVCRVLRYITKNTTGTGDQLMGLKKLVCLFSRGVSRKSVRKRPKIPSKLIRPCVTRCRRYSQMNLSIDIAMNKVALQTRFIPY